MIEAKIEPEPVTTVQPGAGKTLADKLRDLKEAHDTGLIDDAEWAASKKMCLNSFTSDAAHHVPNAVPVMSTTVVKAQPGAVDLGAPEPGAPLVDANWTAAFPKIATEDLAGDYCCMCC